MKMGAIWADSFMGVWELFCECWIKGSDRCEFTRDWIDGDNAACRYCGKGVAKRLGFLEEKP